MKNHTEEPTQVQPTEIPTKVRSYWRANLHLIMICLFFWALCSFGFAIWLRPLLAGIQVGGTDLGFWFAQQGSIISFIIIIFFYAWRMNQLDKKFGVDEE